MPSRVFSGYASKPDPLADTIRNAATRINTIPDVNVKTWEDLRIGGRILLDAIEEEIRGADVSIFDLTQLNENVLFELGVALGADRVIWPTRDPSDTSKQNEWRNLGLLDSLGQIRFTNSEEIYATFLSERPDLQGEPLFSTRLANGLSGGRVPGVFYVAEPQQTDAGRQVTTLLQERVEQQQVPLVIADPREASVQTLEWFTQHIYSAQAVLVHLFARRRYDAATHNARASLVAGLARGMGRPLLMLAEADYVSALDYRDLLYRYPTAAECRTRVGYWLEREIAVVEEQIAAAREEAEALRLSTELGSVDLGEYVAENETQGLEHYYVETATYRDVLSGDSRVYVGSKGVGKSATVLRAEAGIRADKRNLVCLIKPAGYDLDGLVRLLASYEQRDSKGYVAESLWKYLLLTELALAVERELAARPAGTMPRGPEWELLNFLSDNASWVKADFATRLDATVARLGEASRSGDPGDQRRHIAEALHAGPMRELRALLAPTLRLRRRSFILIDNLDKAWDRGADLAQLSRVILGLLASMDAFRRDLENAGSGGGVPLSLSLFIRSDIFASVAAVAREPDKLPIHRMRWEEEVSLLHVVERRYAAASPDDTPGQELWDRYFCPVMGGMKTQDWIVRVCLPRPRDVLYLCRAAIDQAVVYRHGRVEPDDLAQAEVQYSLFAFEAAAVEGQARVSKIDDVLLEFAGSFTTLKADQLSQGLRGAGVADDAQEEVIDTLRDVSFVGLRTGDDSVVFTDSPREKQRADVLARRYAQRTDGQRVYEVHPAFWAYLEMERTDLMPNLGV